MKTKPFKLTQDAIDDIHHNVKNPLTIIRGGILLLKKKYESQELSSDQINHIAEMVTRQVDRIVSYVNHFEADIMMKPTDGEDEEVKKNQHIN